MLGMSDTSIPNGPEQGAPQGTTPGAAAAQPYNAAEPASPPDGGGAHPGPTMAPPYQAPPQGGSSTDKSFTIVLIALGPLACLLGSFWGAFSVMATDSCGMDCGAGANWAIWLMILAPWVVWLASSIWAVVRLVRKKPAVWIMVGGAALGLVIYIFANVLLSAAVG